MSRFVVPTREGLAAGRTEPADGFTARLTKYVPAEVVTLYTMTTAGIIALKPEPGDAKLYAFGLIVIFLVGTIWYVMKAPSGPVRNAHVVASPIAFLALAYPIAAPLLGDSFIAPLALVGQGVAALVAWLAAPSISEPPPVGGAPNPAGSH
jgi:hypothetical protein